MILEDADRNSSSNLKQGKLFVIAAPSGCGKTTIARAILANHPDMLFSVSATTRQKRNGEVYGKDYFFLTKKEFEERIRKGDLVEYEVIYGNYYGTLKSEVRKALDAGRIMLFDVDVKGALSIKKNFPNETVLIFIEPPSIDVLKKRLIGRDTEDEITIARRLERVPMELEKGKEFDVRIINDDLTTAIAQVEEVIAQKMKSVN